MSRNLYILAAALIVLALVSFGMSYVGGNAPGLPGEAALWRMVALILFGMGAICAFAGTITNLFEQASRRFDGREHRKR